MKSSQRGSIPQLSHAHLLLAEDNELNQEVALGLLEDTGCKVTVAENGKAVLEAVRKESFDLILMDIQMPEMDGYETTRCIREMEKSGELPLADHEVSPDEHLPIIAMTAGTLSRDKHRAFEAGMDDHLSKPVDPDLFFKALARWIPSEVGPAVKADASPGSLTDLAPFPGIDLQTGLSHVNGKEERLLKLMQKFSRDQADVPEKIRRALSDGEKELARRLAHTLKGLAGTVGAKDLQEAARKLEAALKKREKGPAIKPLIATMETALKEVLKGLSKLDLHNLEQQQDLPEAPALSREEALPILDQLAKLLTEGDSEALACLERLEKSGFLAGKETESARLRDLVEAYQFEEAGELLHDLFYGETIEQENLT
jgi:CheY-like chemotaxis protein/HPt (histidine-containing phosphotransfer) domain-containing protein